MNKRAGFSQPVIDAFSVFVIVVIFLVFFVVFSLFSNERTYTIKEQVASVDGSIVLFTYLRTPVSYEGSTMPIAETIQLIDVSDYQRDKRVNDAIRAQTIQFQKEFYESTGCPNTIALTINDHPFKFDYTPDAHAACTNGEGYKATQLIPRNDGTLAVVTLNAGKDLAKTGAVR
jgi:hypothetical protein